MHSQSTLGDSGLFRELDIISSDGYKCYKDFIASLTTAHEHKARHFFLKDCLAEHVLPRSIPKGDNVFGLPFPEQQRLTLRDRILKHGMETGNVFAAVRRARVAYQTHFPAAQFRSQYCIACKTADTRVQKTKENLNKNKLSGQVNPYFTYLLPCPKTPILVVQNLKEATHDLMMKPITLVYCGQVTQLKDVPVLVTILAMLLLMLQRHHRSCCPPLLGTI